LDMSKPPMQEWRFYLRDALDWLRNQLVDVFEDAVRDYFVDPWSVRNDYIKVIWEPTSSATLNFFNQRAKKPILRDQFMKLTNAFEMQYHAMLMFTSCGWFFDDVSRIETKQILRYACRAIELSQTLCSLDVEPEFIRRLEKAVSHEQGERNAAYLYEHVIKPNRQIHEI
jgi:alpha-amylase/alpha-mannosidase (GH57 family)